MGLVAALQGLPNTAVMVIVVAGVVLGTVAAPFAGRTLLRLPPSEGRDSAAFDAFKVVMSMAAALLAFSLVQAVGNLRASEALVSREAASFAAVDRSLLRFGTQAAVAVRPRLVEYAQARMDLEWPRLDNGERDGTTDERYNALSREARALQPADNRQQSLFAELLRGLDDLAEARELTIQNTDMNLPAFFWIAAFGQLAIGMLFALLMVPTGQRLLVVGGTAAALGMVLALLIIVDHPFGGEAGVKPLAIAKILAVNARRS